MDSSPLATLCEEWRHTRDEEQDTGFNTREFAESREQGICAAAIVVRCIVRHRDQVLLCQRADEPRRGCWNTPGGFLENGETLRAAVIRETLEESGVRVQAPKLAYLHKLPQLNQIVMTFLAEAQSPAIAPGPESLDARLFRIDSVPWRQLAFPTDSDALRRTLHLSPYRERRLQIVECFWDAAGRIFARQR